MAFHFSRASINLKTNDTCMQFVQCHSQVSFYNIYFFSFVLYRIITLLISYYLRTQAINLTPWP